jgi:hypothetical protein
MRVITPCLFLIAVAACATSEAKTADDLTVSLASVTLADQCPTAKPPPPPPPSFAKPPPANAPARSQTKDAARGPAARGSCAGPGQCGGPRRHCEQTSMQLSFTPSAGFKGSVVKIKRVELLDAKGKLLQQLTPSAPMQWSAAAGAYAAWDQKLGGDVIRATYKLSSPDWNKLTGGRMNAPGHTFQLRVIVNVGSSDRTVEKTSIVPARVAPMVVT